MEYISICCRLALLVIVMLITGCSSTDKFYLKTGFLTWDTFADQLGTGSSVTEAKSILTGDGDAEIRLVKAEHPAEDSTDKKYPYSAVFFRFNKTHDPVDLSGYKEIHLEYRLSGQLCLMLAQEGIPSGQEYRVELPSHEKYTQSVFSLEDFAQPEWVTKPYPLDLKKISGVKFRITAHEKTTSILGIRSFALK